MVTALEKGRRILKIRQAMLNAGVPVKLWPSLPKKKSPLRKKPNPDAPKYTWAPWGTSGVVHDNCYDYAFGSFSNKRASKSVPGNRSGIGSNGLTFTTCKGIVQRVLSDNPSYAVYQLKIQTQTQNLVFIKSWRLWLPIMTLGTVQGTFTGTSKLAEFGTEQDLVIRPRHLPVSFM
jgi:hypothetical protein